MSKQFLFVLVLVAISSTAGVRGQSPTAATKHALPDFDVREQRDTDGPSNDQIVGRDSRETKCHPCLIRSISRTNPTRDSDCS